MSDTPPNTPPTETPTVAAPGSVLENAPTTLPESGLDKAPDNAPQSASASHPETTNSEGGNTEELPQPEEGGKTLSQVSQVALEAINGDWGNPTERRKRLKDAGWDLKMVEAEIIRVLNS